MHNHVLPGVDDGSPDMATSLQMLEKYVDMGWEKVTITPHINEDYFPNSSDHLRTIFRELCTAASEKGIELELQLAAEYKTDELFRERLQNKDLLTVGDSHVLIELPFFHPPLDWEQYFFDIQMKGLTPILAHAERYTYWARDLDKFYILQHRGVQLQLNLSSVLGKYGPEVKNLAFQLIKNGAYQWVATDAHKCSDLDTIANKLPQKWPNQLKTSQFKNNVVH
jgi:protein-tyrosine phosphatase